MILQLNHCIYICAYPWKPQLLTLLIMTLLLIHGQHVKKEELFNIFVTQVYYCHFFSIVLCLYLYFSLQCIIIYVMCLFEKSKTWCFCIFRATNCCFIILIFVGAPHGPLLGGCITHGHTFDTTLLLFSGDNPVVRIFYNYNKY